MLITNAEGIGCLSDIIDFLTATSWVPHRRIKSFDVANELGGLRRNSWQEHEVVSVNFVYELAWRLQCGDGHVRLFVNEGVSG
ncbi:hypothetical protein CXR25_11950 [Brevibacterium aurantiacum]|uniref:hypothetical protein n=1 Tax=Brevibacterium aurantiacum TaxID=273384 RepID=UPI0001BC2DD1|nr:hypothetical protein [Brevibacterium aurantiacum]AZL13440.1 hypothetical protein CXR25_11950 [Brevibacterium aurantiacum]